MAIPWVTVQFFENGVEVAELRFGIWVPGAREWKSFKSKRSNIDGRWFLSLTSDEHNLWTLEMTTSHFLVVGGYWRPDIYYIYSMKDPPTCKIRDGSVFPCATKYVWYENLMFFWSECNEACVFFCPLILPNTQQVPPRMEGPFLWMCPYLLKVKKQVVHHPRCK